MENVGGFGGWGFGFWGLGVGRWALGLEFGLITGIGFEARLGALASMVGFGGVAGLARFRCWRGFGIQIVLRD